MDDVGRNESHSLNHSPVIGGALLARTNYANAIYFRSKALRVYNGDYSFFRRRDEKEGD